MWGRGLESESLLLYPVSYEGPGQKPRKRKCPAGSPLTRGAHAQHHKMPGFVRLINRECCFLIAHRLHGTALPPKARSTRWTEGAGDRQEGL